MDKRKKMAIAKMYHFYKVSASAAIRKDKETANEYLEKAKIWKEKARLYGDE